MIEIPWTAKSNQIQPQRRGKCCRLCLGLGTTETRAHQKNISDHTSISAVRLQPHKDTDEEVANADRQIKDLVEFHKAFGLKFDCFLLLKSLNHENTHINTSVFLSDAMGFLKCASI